MPLYDVRITEKTCKLWHVEAETEEAAIQKAWDGDGEQVGEVALNADVIVSTLVQSKE
jgi:hypothetical protein